MITTVSNKNCDYKVGSLTRKNDGQVTDDRQTDRNTRPMCLHCRSHEGRENIKVAYTREVKMLSSPRSVSVFLIVQSIFFVCRSTSSSHQEVAAISGKLTIPNKIKKLQLLSPWRRTKLRNFMHFNEPFMNISNHNLHDFVITY